MGFCWGVRRAIDIMEKAADERGEIISLGPIVHNPQVGRELEGRGGHPCGDPDHREVRGVLAWAGASAIAIRDGDPLPAELPSRLAVISQTTQSPERFAEFVSRLMREHIGRIGELRVINTLCDVTSSQQAAARELAQEVDLVLVVGGRSSANTRHLLDVCKEEGSVAYHVEGPDDLMAEWLKGCERVGVTAGAPHPDSARGGGGRRGPLRGGGAE